VTVVERVEDQALAGLDMAQMTPQVSELLEKALEFSTQERGLLAARLIDSLDDAPASAVNRVGKGTASAVPPEPRQGKNFETQSAAVAIKITWHRR
jgi:hypothetical protein